MKNFQDTFSVEDIPNAAIVVSVPLVASAFASLVLISLMRSLHCRQLHGSVSSRCLVLSQTELDGKSTFSWQLQRSALVL